MLSNGKASVENGQKMIVLESWTSSGPALRSLSTHPLFLEANFAPGSTADNVVFPHMFMLAKIIT